MVWIAVGLVVFLAGSVLWARVAQQQAQNETGAVEQQRDQTAAQAASLAEQITAACSSGELTGPVCQQAEQVAQTPVPPAAPVTGAPGRPPTGAEIQAAVDAYLLAHPPPAGRAPTAAEVAAAVASYLSANPPTPGRAPTAEEISAAVAQYFAANPVRDGRDGRDATGEPGRPPTAEEIRAAVDAYLAEHPPPQGPKGDAGPTCPAGTSLQPVEFASGETGLGCVDDEQLPDDETEQPTVTATPTSAPTTGP
jgi:hypothetical protein